jgi:2-amino-4-hydroxy-6-hydroxymethyldihydropteridine diphosphokinase
MSRAAIALGSNLGPREQNLAQAVEELRAFGTVTAVSSSFDTEPVGYLDQPCFLNAAVTIETELPPLELLRALLAIERTMGRDRTHGIAKGPRVIDLDLLLYDDVRMQSEDLTLPHPELSRRRFVLEPLAQIAPDMSVPGTSATVHELLVRLND